MPETPKRQKKPTSYDVLRKARRLIDDEVITLAEMARRADMPPTSLSAMIRSGYENITLTRCDRIRDVVDKLHEEMEVD